MKSNDLRIYINHKLEMLIDFHVVHYDSDKEKYRYLFNSCKPQGDADRVFMKLIRSADR